MAGQQNQVQVQTQEFPTTADLARLRVVLGRLGRLLRQQTAANELTPHQVSLLFSIERTQPVTAGDLAVIEGVTPPSITRFINRLTELGLITRDYGPHDRRVAVLRLTLEGKAECRRIRGHRDEWLMGRLNELDPRDMELLLNALPALEKLYDPSLPTEHPRVADPATRPTGPHRH